MHIERATTPTEHALQREFAVHVAGETVPGVLWTPAPQAAGPPRALIVLGHGGAQHKTSPGLVGLALFDAFGSREKAMHIHPGGHLEVPQAEVESWERFFERQLG